jgi:hypothetical protein
VGKAKQASTFMAVEQPTPTIPVRVLGTVGPACPAQRPPEGIEIKPPRSCLSCIDRPSADPRLLPLVFSDAQIHLAHTTARFGAIQGPFRHESGPVVPPRLLSDASLA